MSNNQYLGSYASPTRNTTAMQFQTVNPYAALVATAGPDNDKRSSSSGSPPSSGSSASLLIYNEGVKLPQTPSRPLVQTHSSSIMLQQHIYRSPEQVRAHDSSTTNSTSTRHGYGSRATDARAHHATGRTSVSSATSVTSTTHGYQTSQAPSLVGVPESVAVQEMAFRQGQLESSSPFDTVPASPFARQFDQLWKACYKLGKECGSQRATTPVNTSQQVFAWPVLINPYTQSLKNPYGALDAAWSRKMIQAALSCMEELVRVTCRRNNGWDKTVADIPLPAQEALVAFPDLAQQYEQLKRDAKEARAGGRPYGY